MPSRISRSIAAAAFLQGGDRKFPADRLDSRPLDREPVRVHAERGEKGIVALPEPPVPRGLAAPLVPGAELPFALPPGPVALGPSFDLVRGGRGSPEELTALHDESCLY